MATILTKLERELQGRLMHAAIDGSTTDQVMVDLAVIILSKMRSGEIEKALLAARNIESVDAFLGSRVSPSPAADAGRGTSPDSR